MSKASVSRDLITVLWRRLCLQPRRTEGFKFSTGPQLEAEVRDDRGNPGRWTLTTTFSPECSVAP